MLLSFIYLFLLSSSFCLLFYFFSAFFALFLYKNVFMCASVLFTCFPLTLFLLLFSTLCIVLFNSFDASPDATWSRVQTEKIQKQLQAAIHVCCHATYILWTNELGNEATAKEERKNEKKYRQNQNKFILHTGTVVAHVCHLRLPFYSKIVE